MNDLSKTLIFFGSLLIVLGAALSLFNKIPGLGRLPGDIWVRKGNLTFYFPLATGLLISLLLTLLLNLFGRR